MKDIKDVPVGETVKIKGKEYVCEETKSFSCNGCGLHSLFCYNHVRCISANRKDDKNVIYRRVKK